MSFSSEFFLYTLSGGLFALLWFGLPGLLISRLLGLNRLLSLLAAPALGLCTYGGPALLFCYISGYTPVTLLLSWLIFTTGAGFIHYRYRAQAGTGIVVPGRTFVWLAAAAAGWALLPTLNIYPFVHEGGLFVNTFIFDHAKVAMTDAIAREGLLPLNPYYAPAGERIPLIYYYTWHFLASHLKLLLPIPGWPVEVVMTWFTAFAALGFLMFTAMFFTRRARAGVWVLLFALCGMLTDIFAYLPPPLVDWLIPPDPHVEVLWLQAAWVPQHVLSALAIVVMIFLLSRMVAGIGDEKSRPYLHALSIGIIAATGFGASTWVGGIGLGMVLPAFALMLLWLRLPPAHYLMLAKLLGLAMAVCMLVALPLLISQTSGPPLSESKLPFGFRVYPSTPLSDKRLINVLMFWLQLLPMTLGISYLLGLPAMLARTARHDSLARAFMALSVAGTVGHLLVAQFSHSTFWNNSFGWRVVLVPGMLLLVWSAIALSELPAAHNLQQWRPRAWLVRGRRGLVIIATVGLTLGIFSTLRVFHLPAPAYRPPPPEELAQRQGFLRQRTLWAKVREYAGPHDLVQANPDGYRKLTPWPATLPYALFADRSTAYANAEYATVFAYRYDLDANNAQGAQVREVFSAAPSETAIRYVHDTLRVKVLLVDHFDPVWHSDALDRSGLYRVVYADAQARIYK